MEMFLTAFAPVFRLTVTETVNQLLTCSEFNKSKWNTYLQTAYSINKRHANGVIAYSNGKVDSAKQHRSLHIKTLTGKIKSIEVWRPLADKKLKAANKFYFKKNWRNSKVGGNFPLGCSLNYKETNW